MDIKKYIASGILEQYAFGLLSPEEQREVEANLQQYPELKDELHQIEYTLEQYVSSYAVEPTEGFRAQLNDHLSEVEPDPAPSTSAPPANRPTAAGGSYWMLGLLVLSLAAASWLFYDNYQKDVAYNALETELTVLQETCDETNDVNRGLLQQLQTIRQSGNSLIQMRATGIGAEDAIAAVVYNPEAEKSYLDVINLSEPATDRQYQLWAIVDGTPVDMGVFEINITSDSTLIEVPFIENAQAFAITLEPRGGSEVPTLDQMVVLGSVG